MYWDIGCIFTYSFSAISIERETYYVATRNYFQYTHLLADKNKFI